MRVSLRKTVFFPEVSLPVVFFLLPSSQPSSSVIPPLLVLGMFSLQKNILPCISSIGVIKYRDQDKFKWKSLCLWFLRESPYWWGRHSIRQLEQEAKRPYLQPQTQRVQGDYRFSKPAHSDILARLHHLPKQHHVCVQIPKTVGDISYSNDHILQQP